jgi:hypothetical protein
LPISTCAFCSRRWITSAESSARRSSLARSSAKLGGSTKTRTRSGRSVSIAESCSVPCQSMSNNTSLPCASAFSTGARGVP